MKKSTFTRKAGLAIASLGLSTLFTASAGTLNVNPGDSIQAAVDAAVSGDTIQIGAGVYEQQILVSRKDLNLVGEPGAILKAPAAMIRTLPVTSRRAILGIVLCEANVSGLEFDGNHSGQANARLTGIYHLNSNGTVSDCSFHGFRGAVRTPLLETAYLAANLVAVSQQPDLTHVEVLDNTFSDNEGNIGMIGDDANQLVATELRQTFLVAGNAVTGSGPGAGVFEFGIRVTVGASGAIQHNTITDFLSVAPSPVLGPVGSAGVLVFDTTGVGNPSNRPNGPVTTQPVLVEGNTLLNNAGGVEMFRADGSRAVNNVIECAVVGSFSNEGGISLSGKNLGAVNNRILSRSVGVNLLANPTLGVARDAKVIANRISGAATPIGEQVGVTGTKQYANKISP
jgi:hypothetical protein